MEQDGTVSPQNKLTVTMEDVQGLPTPYLMAVIMTTVMRFTQKQMQLFTQIGQHVQTETEQHYT